MILGKNDLIYLWVVVYYVLLSCAREVNKYEKLIEASVFLRREELNHRHKNYKHVLIFNLLTTHYS